MSDKPYQTQRSLTIDDLIDGGLLWYVNRVALHPRGLALGVETDLHGDIEGLFLNVLDGTEPYAFPHDVDVEKYTAFEDFVAALRHEAKAALDLGQFEEDTA